MIARRGFVTQISPRDSTPQSLPSFSTRHKEPAMFRSAPKLILQCNSHHFVLTSPCKLNNRILWEPTHNNTKRWDQRLFGILQCGLQSQCSGRGGGTTLFGLNRYVLCAAYQGMDLKVLSLLRTGYTTSLLSVLNRVSFWTGSLSWSVKTWRLACAVYTCNNNNFFINVYFHDFNVKNYFNNSVQNKRN